MLHMIIEQTFKYPFRMIYNPESRAFTASDSKSLFYERRFMKPYGWIKESGTPPGRHWDCILMSDGEYDLGDEIAVKVIGVFKRADLDHKYVAVEETRGTDDLDGLSAVEIAELKKLYPRIRDGEGWFGKEIAEYCMEHQPKAF